jgi:hypothetical protein
MVNFTVAQIIESLKIDEALNSLSFNESLSNSQNLQVQALKLNSSVKSPQLVSSIFLWEMFKLIVKCKKVDSEIAQQKYL